MMKETSKPDYKKMNSVELQLLLNKHRQMLTNKRLVSALPDKGERLRRAIHEIEQCLIEPSSPMDCDTMINEFHRLAMPSSEISIGEESRSVHLSSMKHIVRLSKMNSDYSDKHFNEVKQRLKARQAERENQPIASAKLISLDEAIRLQNEQKRLAEEHLIQQTTARLLGNMSLSQNTFGLPITSKDKLAYRGPHGDSDDEDEEEKENKMIGHKESDGEGEEIDYPEEDDEDEND